MAIKPSTTAVQTHIRPLPQTDYEVRTQDAMCVNESAIDQPLWTNVKYAGVGVVFGVLFLKAEIVSWLRIQEMFRLESFHMYGIIGSAVVVGMISLQIIKRFKLRSAEGEAIALQPKKFNKGQVYGGLVFGLGWAMTGACPGPLFAQMGAGATAVLVTFLSALSGTWLYGKFRDRLPH
jgi:uncharacterized protein